MRILVVTSILLFAAIVPVPGAADHDPSDQYVTIGSGNDPLSFYIDDGFPPKIFRETNNKPGLQRASDNSGHMGHGNPDQRLF